MADVEKSELEQREVLRQHGWIPVDGKPIGEGGGARIFKVLKMAIVDQLGAQLMTPHNDRERARTNATAMAQLLGNLLDGTELVVAAGKVAKRPDHRLKREIEILRDVKHPHLVQLLDFDQSNEPAWYVMPVMRGGTLHGRLDLKGNLPAVVRGMREIASVLAALHSHANPIVHRDIKPKNIFVSENGSWILGDPGVAHRDDGGDETTTRPVSKDWAPTWYGEELAQTPKADLYMLGKTVLSVLVGGDKPLDPSHVTKPKFNLPDLLPGTPGVEEVYKLLRTLIVAEQEEMPFENASELVPVLDELLPVVEDSEIWHLRRELESLKRETRAPRLVLSYTNSNPSLVSGDHPGLSEVMLEIPAYCTRLVFWPRGHADQHWGARLHVGNNVVAIVDGLASDVPTAMEIPAEARGEPTRITITNKSGMLHSLMVYAEA